MLIEAALLPRNFSSHLLRFHCITVQVPLRQKVTVPTVPVRQQCYNPASGGNSPSDARPRS
jgi:hypothetical protein